jgi:D-alanine transaminase
MREQGVACVTIEDQRWQRCDIKSISLLGNVLAAQYAAEQQATEAIQLRDDFLTEGASSNIWVVKDGIVSGPPRDHLILEGIRYRLIEELSAAQAIAFRERPIHRDALLDADEVLLSSAGRELLPVTCIDGKPVANGRPGPIYEALYAAYQAVKPARKSLA